MAYRDASVAVLIPAYNEATQIAGVIASLPSFVDHVVVVDDASQDATSDVVREIAETDPRVVLFTLEQNRGVGGAIAVAYEWARDGDVDVAVSMDGDGQMDPAEMQALLDPIVEGRADFTKGNRFSQVEDLQRIPRLRLFGNLVLTVMTKIASGYWTISDSQTGYTAVGRHALEHIDWSRLYARYGRPNDVIVRANVARCRIADVPIRAVYGVGERSSMKLLRVTFGISTLLFRRFWWRLWTRHVLLEFHPMVLLYLLGTASLLTSFGLGVHVLRSFILDGALPQLASIAMVVLAVAALNSIFLALWMDLVTNQPLSLPLQIRRRRGAAPQVVPTGDEREPVAERNRR